MIGAAPVRGRSIKKRILAPLHDFIGALNRACPVPSWWCGLVALGAALAAWWVYVPVHELLHAFGCIGSGGTVERLEISPEYGAALLQKVFPFVAVGSDYAGQLVDYDTKGSDLVYAATVYAPYLVTIFVGVPLLREVARRGRGGFGSCALLGAAVPLAFASFANVAGDLYELGSIPVSRLAVLLSAGADAARWRSDDLPRLVRTLLAGGAFRLADATVLLCSFTLGTLCAFATYSIGASFHRLITTAARRER